jgi:RNA polymerase sigma-70 factor (ECF subfamily)
MAPPPDPDVARQREVVDAFLAAARAGDFDALVAVLDPEVVFRIDTGGAAALARPPVEGSSAVARQVLERAGRFAPHARPAIVNGTPGFVVGSGAALISVVGFAVVDGRIAEIDIITDRKKLRRLM